MRTHIGPRKAVKSAVKLPIIPFSLSHRSARLRQRTIKVRGSGTKCAIYGVDFNLDWTEHDAIALPSRCESQLEISRILIISLIAIYVLPNEANEANGESSLIYTRTHFEEIQQQLRTLTASAMNN